MDNNIVYVAYNNNIILGIFDNEQTLNYNLDGCLQKGFIQKRCIRIEKYIKNSFIRLNNTDRYFGDSNDIDAHYHDSSRNYNLDISGSHFQNVSDKQKLDISCNILDTSSNLLDMSSNMLDTSGNIL